MLKMLATLLPIDAGEASIFGVDVRREPHVVRQLLGVTGQYASVDELLTATENLVLFARCRASAAAEARRTADRLLEQFDLTEAANKPIKHFSGGMRRRLDLAASLITRPPLIFLDEPTTGLDPRTRGQMWETIRELVREGSTVLLTTQYLDEADQLADRIAGHRPRPDRGARHPRRAQVVDRRLRAAGQLADRDDLDRAAGDRPAAARRAGRPHAPRLAASPSPCRAATGPSTCCSRCARPASRIESVAVAKPVARRGVPRAHRPRHPRPTTQTDAPRSSRRLR